MKTEFKLEGSEYIELFQLLKVMNIASSGADAKYIIDDGEVTRKGEIEYRRRAKIRHGDKIKVGEITIEVV